MTATTLQVMVLESRRGAAGEAVRDLEAAGHHPLSCHGDPYVAPCRGLASPADCPLAHDPDVALLVRPAPDP